MPVRRPGTLRPPIGSSPLHLPRNRLLPFSSQSLFPLPSWLKSRTVAFSSAFRIALLLYPRATLTLVVLSESCHRLNKGEGEVEVGKGEGRRRRRAWRPSFQALPPVASSSSTT